MTHEIDFGIDLLLDAKRISVPPYWMASAELKELKVKLKDVLDKGFIQLSILTMASLGVVCEKEGLVP